MNRATQPQSCTMDTVRSFSEYTGIGLTLAYQYTRAKGFPIIQTCKRGKILIEREAALEWMRNLTAMRKH